MSTRLKGFTPGSNYHWSWFDPRNGEWSRARLVKADASGVIAAPAFPGRRETGHGRYRGHIAAKRAKAAAR